MKKLMLIFTFISIFSISVLHVASAPVPYSTEEFKKYWYSGNAEITTYKLEQARYGEVHKGYAVLIFVTEDFSKNKQVKLDNPAANKEDAVKILKLNLVKKFNTGIYRYSIMESVFTPVYSKSYPDTLKLTSSSQEWCGNVFTQLNLDENNYDIELFSYFESEGDKKYQIEKTFLEDEIFTRIRLNPENLPTGNISLIPSLIVSRLKHQEIKPVRAVANLKEIPEKNEMNYSVKFPDTGRQLNITFEKDFPYEIISWEERYKSGFGRDSKELVTRAVRDKSVMLDYWNKNSTFDEVLREKMGIE